MSHFFVFPFTSGLICHLKRAKQDLHQMVVLSMHFQFSGSLPIINFSKIGKIVTA